jgi:hypothetical protein
MRRAPSAACLVLAACASHGGEPREVLALEDDASVFGYLAAKYDADGDGSIAPAEYSRAGARFEDLDADGDGALTQADFPDEVYGESKGIADMPPELRARLRAAYDARAAVLTYLQPDPEADGLSREGLDAALAALDQDGDGALAPEELARATDARPWAGPGQAWDLLAAAIDRPGDGDGRLSRAELEAYHAAMAGDDGLLRGPPSGWSAGRSGPAGDGPAVGAFAPDFTLAEPDGRGAVRLVQWRGKKPVALIFGSYT